MRKLLIFMKNFEERLRDEGTKGTKGLKDKESKSENIGNQHIKTL